MRFTPTVALLALLTITPALHAEPLAPAWHNWRGPTQMGASRDVGLPDRVDPDKPAWSIDLAGRGTAVGTNKQMYIWGYVGDGLTKREVLVAVDPGTGKEKWRRHFNDFLSDPIYSRYAIGAPTVDPATGNVYLMTTPGEVLAHTPEGKRLWSVSMMERFGRLTFPNGRTGAVAIDGDLAIVNAISSFWGAEGPTHNRLYAFDKTTGEPVWSSTPGVGPPFLKDSSMATPIFETRDGYRVLYVGLGDGNVACVNARTGEPIWRYQFAIGGINSSMLIHGNKLIAVHGKENPDSTRVGGMIAIDLDKAWKTWQANDRKQAVLRDDHVRWRNHLVMFTSSPTLVGDRIYQCTHYGELACVDADTGKVLWEEKLAPSQLHASPLYADGKLYVPYWNGSFFIIKPTDDGPQVLQKVELAGDAIGSPSTWGGRLFVHSTEKFYCFTAGDKSLLDTVGDVVGGAARGAIKAGDSLVGVGGEVINLRADGADRIRPVPYDVLLRPGESVAFDLQWINDMGGQSLIKTRDLPTGEPYIPPTAKVKARLDATFNGGTLTANESAKYSAGAFRVTQGGKQGVLRGRILPSPPYAEDFESFELTQTADDGARWGWPPLPWIGARMRWDIRADPTDPDNQVYAKTIDRVILQRATTFIGHPDDRHYTVTMDVMTDGNRRIKGNVGMVNQRYYIALIGNAQRLEVWSNHDNYVRAQNLGAKTFIPFKWQARKWYTLKSRVDANDDGSGVVRAKAWPKGEAEPAQWMLNVEVPHANTHGSPGIYGFAQQARYRVFVDNVKVEPNQ